MQIGRLKKMSTILFKLEEPNKLKDFFLKNPANSHLFKWLLGGNWVYEITLKFNQDCVN